MTELWRDATTVGLPRASTDFWLQWDQHGMGEMVMENSPPGREKRGIWCLGFADPLKPNFRSFTELRAKKKEKRGKLVSTGRERK